MNLKIGLSKATGCSTNKYSHHSGDWIPPLGLAKQNTLSTLQQKLFSGEVTGIPDENGLMVWGQSNVKKKKEAGNGSKLATSDPRSLELKG